jgi:hypothetical protein
MAAGMVGYKLISDPLTSLPQPAPRSSQFDQPGLVSEQPASAAHPLKSAPGSSASPVSSSPVGPEQLRVDAAQAQKRDELAKVTVSTADAAVPGSGTAANVREDRGWALKLKQKGDDQLALGLIIPARLLYEKAADLGLPQAALALAGTYDEVALTHSDLRGVDPDPKAAARWYERARLPPCSIAATAPPQAAAITPKC